MKAQYTTDGLFRIIQGTSGNYFRQKPNNQKPTNRGEQGWENYGGATDKETAQSWLRSKEPPKKKSI